MTKRGASHSAASRGFGSWGGAFGVPWTPAGSAAAQSRCVKITRCACAHGSFRAGFMGGFYRRFIGGFGRDSCHSRQSGRTVRRMRNVQRPDPASSYVISLI
jgi:hypothetical protein